MWKRKTLWIAKGKYTLKATQTEMINDRFFRSNNLYLLDSLQVSKKYEMPVMLPCDLIPDRIIPFNEAIRSKDYGAGIHFFIDDYQFERLWNNPERYLKIISKFRCIFATDFSLYMNMPMPLKIWNTYKNRILGAWMQQYGLKVIPSVSWAGIDSFDYCFEGLPINSTLAISTIGCTHRKNYTHWKCGIDEMIERLQPKTILIYGNKLEYDYKMINTIYYPNNIINRIRQL